MAKQANNVFRIEMIILKIISTQECYGYQISQLIKTLTEDHMNLAEGTLYPILYKLIDQGYIEDHKKLVGKRKTRVYYTITDFGKEYLQSIYDEYTIMSNYVNQIMNWNGDIDNE